MLAPLDGELRALLEAGVRLEVDRDVEAGERAVLDRADGVDRKGDDRNATPLPPGRSASP
jgi:hypothetical protein